MKQMRIRHIILASLLAVTMTFAACKASPAVRVAMPTAQKIDQQMQPYHTQKTSSQTSSSSQTSNASAASSDSTSSTDSAAGQATPSATTSNGADLPGGTYGNSGGSNGVAGQGTGTGGTGSASSVASASSSSSTQSVPDRLAAPTAVQVDGQTKQLPTDATKVAAAGQYADMVCILGGADALLDTSPENKSGLFQEVFNPAETTAPDMPTVGNAISQSNFDNLLNNVKPQMVFYTDGTFTQDQLAQLTAAQIWPVELIQPTANVISGQGLNSGQAVPFTDLQFNVDTITKVMSSSSKIDGQNPADIATSFDQYIAQTISKAQSAPSGWSDGHATTTYADNFSINSTQIGNILYNFSPITLDQFLAYHANPWDLTDSGHSDSMLSNIRYGQYLYRYLPSLRYGLENNYFTSSMDLINAVNLYPNGCTEDYLEPLDNGWRSLPPVSQPVHADVTKLLSCHLIVKSTGVAGGEPGETAKVFYRGTYGVFAVELDVQPTGLHSWTSGGPESILEPLWLDSVLNSSSYSAAQFRSDLAGFYVKFYHCSQSTASTLAASILSVNQ